MSDDLSQLFEGLVLTGLDDDGVKAKAQALRDAMKGFGTNEKKLIDTLADMNPVVCEQVGKAFEAEFKKNLIKNVKDECGGKFEDSLVALLQPPAVTDAQWVKKAIKGMGTKESVLIDTLCTVSDDVLVAVQQAYVDLYGAPAITEIHDDLGGNLQKFFDAMLSESNDPGDDKVDENAKALYDAGENKMGTNEKKFIDIIALHPREHVAKVAAAYETKYGKPLIEAIKSEFSGSLKKALVFRCTPIEECLAARLFKAMDGMGTDEAGLWRALLPNRDRTLSGAIQLFPTLYKKSLAEMIASEISGDFKKLLVAVVTARSGMQ
jgi:hypothetical protein